MDLPFPDHNGHYKAYALVAGRGALLELQMRLLASKSGDAELRKYSFNGNLEDAEEHIARVYANALTAEEAQRLQRCRRLRNKILHCNFPKVREHLVAIGAAGPEPGQVFEIDLEGSAPQRPITELPVTDGGLYGWFLEFVRSGDFREAIAVFNDALSIMYRLALL